MNRYRRLKEIEKKKNDSCFYICTNFDLELFDNYIDYLDFKEPLTEQLGIQIIGGKRFYPNENPLPEEQDFFTVTNPKRYNSSKIYKKVYKNLLSPTIVSIIIMAICYFLLFTAILTKGIFAIIIFIFNYLLASFYQLSTFPLHAIYSSRIDFEDYLKKCLNCTTKITLNSRQNTFHLPGQYVTDITGKIDIPDKINFVKINKIQIIISSNLNEMIYQSKKIYDFNGVNIVNKYKGKELKWKNNIYMIKSNNKYSNIDWIDLILCIFLIHWIRAFYYICSSHFTFLEITPVKLVSDSEVMESPTEINIQGKIIKPEQPYIKEEEASNKEINKLKKDYSRYKKDLKMEEEMKKDAEKKRKDKESNTFTLSNFYIPDLYDIEIIRIYSDVYAIIQCRKKKKEKIYLGTYDENVKEQTIEEGEKNIYIPNGFNTKIIIDCSIDYINIIIGGKYNKRFERYD